MKVHNDLKELLQEFLIHREMSYHTNKSISTPEIIEAFVSCNSLALGKPEPLAKNKQCDDDFYCNWFLNGDSFERCTNQCDWCKNNEKS